MARDIKKEVPNIDTPFRRVKRAWLAGEIVDVKISRLGITGFALIPENEHYKTISGLPENFFSIELLKDVDINNPKSLISFLKKWGFPYSLYRYLRTRYEPYNRGYDEGLHEASGMYDTDMLYYYHKRISPYPEDCSDYQYISLREAVETICQLQKLVNGLLAQIGGDTTVKLEDFWLLNDAATGTHTIVMDETTRPLRQLLSQQSDKDETATAILPTEYGLTSAIASQMIETIADDAFWYPCKAPDCGHYFKHKRKSGKPRRGSARESSEYCSDTCAERIHKQQQRQSKKIHS